MVIAKTFCEVLGVHVGEDISMYVASWWRDMGDEQMFSHDAFGCKGGRG